MIDIHSHILPGLDDGAEDLSVSIEMAKMAVAEGITSVIATPHKNRKYDNLPAVIQQQVEYLNEALHKQRIPLDIRAGQEIRIYEELVSDLENGELLTLAGSPYILIEFPSQNCPVGAMDTFHELQVRGLVPIIAHPERNAELVTNMSLVYDFVQQGVLTQITSHSLLGLFGQRIRAYTLALCKHNLTHFISSDAHNVTRRGFHLGAAYRMIIMKLGRQACEYFIDNAESVWNYQQINIKPPLNQSMIRKLLNMA